MKKRIIAVILGLLVCLCFVGCNNNTNANANIESKAEENIVSYPQEQAFAEKLITECADSFKDPFSIKVKNVWMYKFEYTSIDRTDYYFTFEFETKNGLGIVETVYYGNHQNSPFRDLSDTTAKEEGHKFASGLSNKFNKNGVHAMQQGVKLDAQAVQEY